MRTQINEIHICRKHNRFQTYNGLWLSVNHDLLEYIEYHKADRAEHVLSKCDKCYADNQIEIEFKN